MIALSALLGCFITLISIRQHSSHNHHSPRHREKIITKLNHQKDTSSYSTNQDSCSQNVCQNNQISIDYKQLNGSENHSQQKPRTSSWKDNKVASEDNFSECGVDRGWSLAVRWLGWSVVVAVLALAIGRTNLLELRRFSPQLYQVKH